MENDNPGMSNTEKEKKDIGWKYAFKDPQDPKKVICKFCNKATTGGIHRAKQHTAANSTNASACLKCPESVRQEILADMNEKAKIKEIQQETKMVQKYRSLKFFDQLDDGTDDEVEEDQEVTRSTRLSKKRPRNDKSGSSTGCTATSNFKGPLDLFVKKSKAKGVNLRQSSIKDYDKEARDRAITKVARFFYQAGVAFNAAKLDSFKEMIEAIGEYGPNLKPPSYHELRVPLLQKEVEYTDELLAENREETKKNGCSIMSDGWSDRIGRTLINFLVNNSKGTMFVESVDASNEVKSGQLLFNLLDKFVERIGEKNVVQVITDNGSNYVLAGKLLENNRPHLFWTPCAAHCIDLMLEDIGKIQSVKATIARGIYVVGFIYNSSGVLSMMRRYTGGRELAKHGVTRFATTFLTLQSLHKRKQDLRRMFLSEEWTNSRWAKEAKGKKVQKIIFMPSFWNSVTYILKIMCPLVMVLRIADNEKTPAMGYIYEAMDRAKETIINSFAGQREKCEKVLEIIDERWDNQLHHPLHAAGYYLNPYFYYHNPGIEKDREVVKGFMKCVERLCESDEKVDKIMSQLTVYKNAEGLLGSAPAIRARNKVNEENPKSPADWWQTFGSSEVPELSEFAVRILSLNVSASGCERNWSFFEHIHSKKRNRLDHKRLRDLVYVKYNQTLKANRAKKIKGDPIKLKNIDECNNEWLLGRMAEDAGDENVFEDHNGLTWRVVAEATGVEEEERQTRSRSNRQKGSNPTRGASTSSRGGRIVGREGRSRKATKASLLVDEESEEDTEDIDANVEVLVDDDGDDMNVELGDEEEPMDLDNRESGEEEEEEEDE